PRAARSTPARVGTRSVWQAAVEMPQWGWTGTSSRLLPETSDQQPHHRHLDERLARLHTALLVTCQSAMPKQPGETPFNDPPARLNGEAARATFPLHDFECPTGTLSSAPVRQLLAPIGRVGPDPLEPRHEGREPAQEPPSAPGIGQVGGGHVPGDGQ